MSKGKYTISKKYKKRITKMILNPIEEVPNWLKELRKKNKNLENIKDKHE